MLRCSIRFGVRRFLSRRCSCGALVLGMGWMDAAQNLPRSGLLCAKGLRKGQGRVPCKASVQQCVLLCFLELAYLHTSYNYHLHSQRHLLEMG